jgi:two-component system, NarL family, sensor histidine kinase UhpB
MCPIQLFVKRQGATAMASVLTELSAYSALAERLVLAETLHKREEHLYEALNAAQLGVWNWQIAEGRLRWSDQAYRLFGFQPQAFEPSFTQFEACVHPDDLQSLRRALVAAIESGTLFQHEYRVIWPDGSVHWLVSTGRTVPTRSGPAARMTGVTARMSVSSVEAASCCQLQLRDQITYDAELPAAKPETNDAARRTLICELIELQEQERRRLARDLHDQAAQQVTAIMLGLKRLHAHSYGRSETLREIEQVQSLVQAMSREMHRLATNLRPVALEDFGLAAALQNYLDDWSRHTQVAAELVMVGVNDHALRPEVATTIYRLATEALTNVARHAAATHVSLVIQRHVDTLVVTIEDNGCGFTLDPDLSQATNGRHLGLLGMHERVSLLDGTLELETQPGQGTTVLVRIPLAFSEPPIH